MTHSPLPWSVQPHDNYMADDEPAPIQIVDANGETVVDNTTFYPHDIKEADARLIVETLDRQPKLEGAIRILLCFFEPEKNPHLDTNALKSAVASAKHLIGQD